MVGDAAGPEEPREVVGGVVLGLATAVALLLVAGGPVRQVAVVGTHHAGDGARADTSAEVAALVVELDAPLQAPEGPRQQLRGGRRPSVAPLREEDEHPPSALLPLLPEHVRGVLHQGGGKKPEFIRPFCMMPQPPVQLLHGADGGTRCSRNCAPQSRASRPTTAPAWRHSWSTWSCAQDTSSSVQFGANGWPNRALPREWSRTPPRVPRDVGRSFGAGAGGGGATEAFAVTGAAAPGELRRVDSE